MRRARVALGLALAATLAAGCGGASADAPGRARLDAPAGGSWLEVTTGDFVLRVQATQDWAVPFATMMQETHDAFAGSVLPCGFRGERARIDVTVLSDRALYDRMFGEAVGGHFASTWRWDESAGRITLPARFESSARAVFQHELGHVLVARCFPSAPPWLHEGLASFLETATVEGGSLLVGIPPYVIEETPQGSLTTAHGVRVRAVPWRGLGDTASLRVLAPAAFYGDLSRTTGDDAERRAGRYALAWALVHLLELDDGALHHAFARFLDDLRRPGVDPERAWTTRFAGLDVDARLESHLALAESPYVAIPYRPATPSAPSVRTLGDGEAHLELARLWWISADAGADARAGAELEAALADPAARPAARLLLAERLATEGRLEDARALVRDALADDPDDPRLLARAIDLVDVARMRDPAARAELEATTGRLEARAESAYQRAMVAHGHYALGRVSRALDASARALARDRTSVPALLVRAEVLVAAQRFDAAIQVVDAALASPLLDDATVSRVRTVRATIAARALAAAGAAEAAPR